MSTPNPSSSEPIPPPLTELAALAQWLSRPDNEGEPDGEAPPPPASGLAALAALLENETPPESARAERAAGRPSYFWPAELMDDREAAPNAAADTPSVSPFFAPDSAIELAPAAAEATPWSSLDFQAPTTDADSGGELLATTPLNLPDEPMPSATVESINTGDELEVPRPAEPVAADIESLTQAVIGGSPEVVKGCLDRIGRQYSASEAIRIFLAASRGAIG